MCNADIISYMESVKGSASSMIKISVLNYTTEYDTTILKKIMTSFIYKEANYYDAAQKMFKLLQQKKLLNNLPSDFMYKYVIFAKNGKKHCNFAKKLLPSIGKLLN